MDDDPNLLEPPPDHLGDEQEDGHFDADSLFVGNGVQASGRVDVPSGDLSVINHTLQMPADALAVAAKSTELVGFFAKDSQ